VLLDVNLIAFQDIFGVSFCTALKSLAITWPVHGRNPLSNLVGVACSLLNIILHLPPSICLLTFVVCYAERKSIPDLSYLQGIPWDTVDALLSSRINLTSVVFRFRDMDDSEPDPNRSAKVESFSGEMELLRENLPRLHTLKVLVAME